MQFDELPLHESLLRGLEATGYDVATPIQQKAIPPLLEGRDLIGCAQTGTGKTAAFALPTLHRLLKPAKVKTGADQRRKRSGRRVIRALILVPTRELAGQVGESFESYGQFSGLRHAVIYGGVKQGSQVRSLDSGVDILVATPGRLLDLIGQKIVELKSVEILILDEADQMLDMGFIHDLRKIVAHVRNRQQTLMFSATMPTEIRKLASEWLNRPHEVKVAPVASTPELVDQSVCLVEKKQKAATLTRFLRTNPNSKTLVFSRTKHGADKIVRFLQRGGIRAAAIHGNKSQGRRQAVMKEFGSNSPPVLVATDLAARGLDFSDVQHVINYDLPDVPETYVHRIGRTARAGARGKAVSFCTPDEKRQLRAIERLIGRAVPATSVPYEKQGPLAKIDTNKSDDDKLSAKSESDKVSTSQVNHGKQNSESKRKAKPKKNVRSSRRRTTDSASGSKRPKNNKNSRSRRKSRQRVAGDR